MQNPYISSLESIRERYSLPDDVEYHLHHLIEQASDEETAAANANMTGTRIQQLIVYLMENHRDSYPEAEAVRDDLAEIYAQIASQ